MIKSGFMDGETYTAEDLNAIVARFITAGIADPMEDGVPYNVKRLNDLSASIYTRGVVGDTSTALGVIKIGSDFYISPGVAYFDNGTYIELTANELISVPEGVTCYVNLVSDYDGNRNYIDVTEVFSEASGSVVPLAEISEEGVITDKRCYSTGRVDRLPQNNKYTLKSMTITEDLSWITKNANTTFSREYDLGCSEMLMCICFINGVHDTDKSNVLFGGKQASVYIPGSGIFISTYDTTFDTGDYAVEGLIAFGRPYEPTSIPTLRFIPEYVGATTWKFNYKGHDLSKTSSKTFTIYYI